MILVLTYTPTRRRRIYIYIYNSHISCGNDKKNEQFYNNQFGSYNSYTSNIQVFHRIRWSSKLLYIRRSVIKMFTNLSTLK